MNMKDIKEFDKQDFSLINNIIGLKLNKFFKQLDFFVLSFGTNANYALHTYSFLRVRQGQEIIMSSTDEYLFPDNTRMPNEIYDKDEMHKKSLLQKTLRNVKNKLRNAVIETVEVSDVADILIKFNNGVIIETFTDCLWQENEYYRFFNHLDRSSPHYIVRFFNGKIILEKV